MMFDDDFSILIKIMFALLKETFRTIVILTMIIALYLSFSATLQMTALAASSSTRGMSDQRLNSFSGMILNYLKTGSETNNDYAVTEITAYPDMFLPMHRHSERESFYILNGEFSFNLGDKEIKAVPGMMIDVPSMIPHAWKNISDRPSRLLSTNLPGGRLEEFLINVGHPISSKSDKPIFPNDEDIELQIKLAPQYGIEVIPPQP